MKDPYASPTLERVLRDLKEDPMVRHEAAKAMGAISSVQSIPTLNELLNGQRREVREMCEIALAKVERDNSAEGKAEMTKSQEENPLVYRYTVYCGFLFIIYFANSSHLKFQHCLCPCRSFGRHHILHRRRRFCSYYNPPRSVSFPVQQIPAPLNLA